MLGTFWRRIKYWHADEREQAGIEEEMRLHLELRAKRLRDAGMNGAEAAAAAQRRFGNQLQLRETSREMWMNRWLDDLLKDIQIGSRGWARNPGFTAVAVLTIALALGANTAIFSVIRTVLLKPLPYPNADRILQVSRVSTGEGGRWVNMSGAQMLYIREHATAFRSVGAMDLVAAGFSLTSAGEPERISGSHISSGMFETLGMAPAAGRVFSAAEDKPGSEDVAVISYSLWQQRFGGAQAVLGSRVTLDGRPYTVVGVMPRGFLARGSQANEDVWVPMRMTFDPKDGVTAFLVAGRVREGTTLEEANAQLAQVSRSLRQEFHDQVNEGQHFEGVRYRDFLVGDVRPALLVLAGAVGLVLLLACANVANLMLARAVSRQKEIAVRTALGAMRGRLLRQLFTESVLLAAIASMIGLVLASFGMRALLQSLPESVPWSGEISFDAPVVAFSFGLAILTSLLFGLAPAWPRSGMRLAETLKATLGRNTSTGSTGRLSTVLVGVEVAVSVVLLVGGALLMQSFVRLRGVHTGFDPSGVLTAKMPLQKHTTTASMMSFLDPVLLRMNAAPGVKSAATVTTLPLELTPQWEFEVDGRADSPISSLVYAVSPLYLETMGIRLNGGRHFTDRDTAASQKVLIVNQAFIRKAFPNLGTAVGQRVHLGKEAALMFHETTREIVGVVADVREDTDGLRNDPAPAAYIPQAQSSDAFSQIINHFVPISLAVKTQGSPTQAVQSVKQIVRSVDPLQPVADIQVMEEIVDRATSRDRFNLTLMGIFAFVALVLASVGIYGVVSYAVSQRIQELGVRIALGASFTDVLGLVIGRGMITALAGVAVGVVGAYALSRFLAGLLFSIKAADPLTFALVTVLMLTVAFVANLVPALRAARVDPIRALRYE